MLPSFATKNKLPTKKYTQKFLTKGAVRIGPLRFPLKLHACHLSVVCPPPTPLLDPPSLHYIGGPIITQLPGSLASGRTSVLCFTSLVMLSSSFSSCSRFFFGLSSGVLNMFFLCRYFQAVWKIDLKKIILCFGWEYTRGKHIC